MGSIPVGDVSKGAKLIFDNQPYLVVELNFVKPGKGSAMYKMRVKNLVSGNVLEKTIRSGDRVDTADVSDVVMTYLYSDANGFVFMNQSATGNVRFMLRCIMIPMLWCALWCRRMVLTSGMLRTNAFSGTWQQKWKVS